MATHKNLNLLQCTGCHEELNLESKTLPCLHSFCRKCLDKHFEGQTNGNGQCPECHEPLTLDRLSLSPFIVKHLRYQQLESLTDWKCDLCSEDGFDPTARNWCHDCQELFCDNCSRFHKKFQPKHNAIHLDGMERGEAILAMMTDMCPLHKKEKECYCEQCNVCFCETCYQNHLADSPECSSRSLSVKDEALKQKSQAPTLAKEMDDLEISLRRLNEKMRRYTEELNSDCDSKCQQVWDSYEEMRENAKRQTTELCEDMKKMAAEQVKRWHHLLEENEKILKELEIWRINLHHLMNESQQDVDVVCGLRSLGAKLSSRLHRSVGPEEKCQLEVTFSNWWLQVLEQLKCEEIGSTSLMVAKNYVSDKQFNLCGSNSDITSIHVSDEDGHVFVSDYNSQSVTEFTEQGELVCECRLFDGMNKFTPWDMCSISRDIFVVVCGRQRKMIFLEKKKIHPSLEIKKIIPTNKEFISLCIINGTIFACDDYFHIDSFTIEGEQLKTIVTGKSRGAVWSRIRADPSTGYLWVTIVDSSKIICFNSNGENLRLVKTEKKITDFCVGEFGHFYFCNYEGLFSFTPKNILYKFTTKTEYHRKIFALRNKIFVCFRFDGEYVIQLFKEVQREVDDLEKEEKSSVKKKTSKYTEELKSKKSDSLFSKVEEIHVEELEKLPTTKNIIIMKQWNLRGSNLQISSIHVSEEDDHVFVCNISNQSIDEYSEGGEFVGEYILSDETTKFTPIDMCSISSDILVVVCGLKKKLIYLKRRKDPPFLQLKTIIDTEEEFLSLCPLNETIVACDIGFQMVSFTKEGEKIKTMKTRETRGNWPLIRADPSTGNLWGARLSSSEIVCFNPNGEILQSVKTENTISDFSLNKFGLFYICNDEGIFSSSSKTYLYKFEKKSKDWSTIFISRKKIFVCLENDGKHLIKIFRIDD